MPSFRTIAIGCLLAVTGWLPIAASGAGIRHMAESVNRLDQLNRESLRAISAGAGKLKGENYSRDLPCVYAALMVDAISGLGPRRPNETELAELHRLSDLILQTAPSDADYGAFVATFWMEGWVTLEEPGRALAALDQINPATIWIDPTYTSNARDRARAAVRQEYALLQIYWVMRRCFPEVAARPRSGLETRLERDAAGLGAEFLPEPAFLKAQAARSLAELKSCVVFSFPKLNQFRPDGALSARRFVAAQLQAGASAGAGVWPRAREEMPVAALTGQLAEIPIGPDGQFESDARWLYSVWYGNDGTRFQTVSNQDDAITLLKFAATVHRFPRAALCLALRANSVTGPGSLLESGELRGLNRYRAVTEDIQTVREVAAKGEAVAQAIWGSWLADGLVVTTNELEAIRWWGRAAKQGNAWAIARLDAHIAARKTAWPFAVWARAQVPTTAAPAISKDLLEQAAAAGDPGCQALLASR